MLYANLRPVLYPWLFRICHRVDEIVYVTNLFDWSDCLFNQHDMMISGVSFQNVCYILFVHLKINHVLCRTLLCDRQENQYFISLYHGGECVFLLNSFIPPQPNWWQHKVALNYLFWRLTRFANKHFHSPHLKHLPVVEVKHPSKYISRCGLTA